MNNLEREFIVYKSDLIEAIHANNKEIIAEMRLIENKISNLEAKVDGKFDKLYYFLFATFASAIAALVSFNFHSLH